MKSQVPAAEFAERVLILYQKPFGDGKLSLRRCHETYFWPCESKKGWFGLMPR